ncbi:MAG: hypothetical protein M5U31_14845 [Acidimicrobiia bacterium]|nr:hypothetical protein [Acidimicrobiia bacterium]
MHTAPVEFLGRVDRSMPVDAGSDKSLESDDPYELVGVRFPVAPGVDADAAVVRCMIEDYALMGWPATRIRQLFGAEEFQGTHDVAARRGADFVEEQIVAVFGPEPVERELSEPVWAEDVVGGES